MATRLPTTVTVPAFGVIRGGRLDGWRFHFLRLVATREELQLVARCTPPAWPFPCDLVLNPYEHFVSLRPIKGERAKRIRVDELFRQAYDLAAIPLPWWASQQRSTLRARLMKSHARPWKGNP